MNAWLKSVDKFSAQRESISVNVNVFICGALPVELGPVNVASVKASICAVYHENSTYQRSSEFEVGLPTLSHPARDWSPEESL